MYNKLLTFDENYIMGRGTARRAPTTCNSCRQDFDIGIRLAEVAKIFLVPIVGEECV
jgi:hypothetical protein